MIEIFNNILIYVVKNFNHSLNLLEIMTMTSQYIGSNDDLPGPIDSLLVSLTVYATDVCGITTEMAVNQLSTKLVNRSKWHTTPSVMKGLPSRATFSRDRLAFSKNCRPRSTSDWRMMLKSCLHVAQLHITCTLRLRKKCTNFETVAQNYKDRFWWHLAEVFKIRYSRVCMLHFSCKFACFHVIISQTAYRK